MIQPKGPHEPVPAGTRLHPDASLRRLEGGRVLVGGRPPRVIRIGKDAGHQVAEWCAGLPVPDKRAARQLARRLLEAGMMHPRPFTGPDPAEVTIVVPVRDRPAELARCLAGLGTRVRVLVVDDASADPAAVAATAAAAGARYLRRGSCGGPAAARNSGLVSVTTPFVAFVDSDCVPEDGWLDALLPHFADPAVAAVAPRIVAYGDGSGLLASYEHEHSVLDMGQVKSIVRPRARVPYVPSAALVVRCAGGAGGFDETLRVGEDVDLVWRLAAAGWQVRYEPAATVAHEHRVRPAEWFARRVAYGTSAAPLSRRHPGMLPAVAVSGWSALAWAAVAAGRPGWGLGATGAATALLARRLSGTTTAAWPLALRLAGAGTLQAGRGLGDTVRRVWWPVALPAALASRRVRLPVVAAFVGLPAYDWARDNWHTNPAAYLAGRLLDDAAYGIGVWAGCVRHRTVAPLLPAVSWRSTKPVGRREKEVSRQPSPFGRLRCYQRMMTRRTWRDTPCGRDAQACASSTGREDP